MGYKEKYEHKYVDPQTGEKKVTKGILNFSCQICRCDTKSHQFDDGSIMCHHCYMELIEGKWKTSTMQVPEKGLDGKFIQTEVSAWECLKCGIKIGSRGIPPKDHDCKGMNSSSAMGNVEVISGDVNPNSEIGFGFGNDNEEKHPDNDPGVI